MWNWYYTDEHVERLMRRNIAYGIKPVKIWRTVLQIYGALNFEGVHPQQCGYFRRRTGRSAGPSCRAFPASSSIRSSRWETLVKYARFGAYG